MLRVRVGCIPVLLLTVLLHLSAMPGSADQWFVGIYGAKAADNRMIECLAFQPEFTDSYLEALTVGREMGAYRNIVHLETEGQWVLHTGPIQKHAEFNALIALRWLWFPWHRYLKTSLAVGDGISYATEKPKLEVNDMGDTSKCLNYIMVEIGVGLPGFPRYDVFVRLHHRSAVFGLINDLSGGSNFVGFGIRYRF